MKHEKIESSVYYSPDSLPDSKPTESDASDAAKGLQAFDSPVRVVFTHRRRRLADMDNLSGKAMLDAIVASGLLPDDSPKWIEEITHRQIKVDASSPEVTIIHMEAVNS